MEEKNHQITSDKPQTGSASATAKIHPDVDYSSWRRVKWPLIILGVVVIGGSAGFGGAWLQDSFDGNNGAGSSVLKTSKEDGNNVTTPSEESIAAVAKAVSPSVVSVLTTSSAATGFYGRSYTQEGAGTGMIVSPDGYIMTNRHVVADASKVTVVLPSGKTYEDVKVLGSDPLNDVAFLKISNVSGLPAITFGDSKTIRIGQTVIAIGNALGQYQNTVTSGIISGIGRPVVASSDGTASGDTETLTDLIQTDAAINSGNSGGPLLNLKGQVIGINTAVAQDAQSIGFAIPISSTMGLLHHVIKTGKVERAYLGVQYIPITPAVKQRYKLSVENGNYVTSEQGSSVQPGGPADKAGVKDGDVITAVNSDQIGEGSSVSTLISQYEPGQTVQLTINRSGKEIHLNVTLGTYPS
jgi:serine protease Do